MDQRLNSEARAADAPGSKRQPSHDDASKMSKKLKQEISEQLSNSSHNPGVVPLNGEHNLDNDSIQLSAKAECTDDLKSLKNYAIADCNKSSEMEILSDDATLNKIHGTCKSSSLNANSRNSIVDKPVDLKSPCEQLKFLPTNDSSETSLKLVKPQNMQLNQDGFWEALKVHVERPHILNRRLCGVVDIWWGTVSTYFEPGKSGKINHKAASVGPRQDSPCNVHDEKYLNQMKVSSGDSLFSLARNTWSILNSTHESKVPLQHEANIPNTVPKSGLKLTTLEAGVIAFLVGRGFKLFGKKDPLVEAFTSLKSGSGGCYVVVRRVLPKLQERYASVTEVVIMDGTNNSCCFLSEVTVPPLLPARPYVICCRECRAVEGGDLCAGDSDLDLGGGGALNDDAVAAPNDAAAPNDTADTNVAATPNDGSAANDAAAPNDATTTNITTGSYDSTAPIDDTDFGTTAGAIFTPVNSDEGGKNVGSTNSDIVAVDAAPEDVAAAAVASNEDSSPKPPLTPCGIFHCSFIPGMCESSESGGSSKGDGRVWLESCVLPRLQKWSLPRESETPPTRSLQLVDLQSYGVLYHALKSKYAAHLIQSWSERTDPKKFVHEDIGIATYLLLLWSERQRPQRFVDLGCGNGLLVYILTKEGHIGTGYDIKRRNIWHERFSDIDLQEREVRPDSTTFSADVDWLIGNHSDELTPWLPVMAARCSQSCSFFLLPCCPHDFTSKFLRRNTSKSQYGDYLDYVSEVGRVCGFEMERDRLKIPSTKRECFVGRTRVHSEEDRPAVLAAMQQFIDARVAQCGPKVPCNAKKSLVPGNEGKNCEKRASPEGKHNSVSLHPESTGLKVLKCLHIGGAEKEVFVKNTCGEPDQVMFSTNAGESNFIVRPKEQRVRNCTQLAKGVKEDLVQCVVDFLLRDCDVKTGKWSHGSSTELRSAAGMLRPDQLQQIKQECGGLKTLLKNHRHIFLVEGSTVRLRVPGRVPEFEKRQRPCWFFVHHPQGCPNAATECMYVH